jgi:hypothetical protein
LTSTQALRLVGADRFAEQRQRDRLAHPDVLLEQVGARRRPRSKKG